MTVIACRDCQQPVSTEGPACPHCGCPTDPKPAKATKSALGNDPRCYVCAQGANRACSRCGQFCCDLHINPPSAHYPAICNRCRAANRQFSIYLLTFAAMMIAIIFGWKIYAYNNPPPKFEPSNHMQEVMEKHRRKMEADWKKMHLPP